MTIETGVLLFESILLILLQKNIAFLSYVFYSGANEVDVYKGNDNKQMWFCHQLYEYRRKGGDV